jgi:hypothetical protein
MIPTWFLHLSGFSMVILGVLQIVQRPHAPGDSFYKRFIHVGMVWSLICIAVGVGLVLMGLGYWQGPLGAGAPPPPPKAPRYH